MDTLGVVAGWLLLVTLVGMVGCAAVRWLVVPGAARDGPADGEWLGIAAGGVGRTLASALPVVLVLVLARQIGEFRDPFAPLAEDIAILMETSWGTAWSWSLVGSLVAAVGFWLAARGRREGWWAASAATAALASFPGLTGHAAGGEGGLRTLTLLADTLHVLGAGAWVGGLFVVLLLDRAWRRSSAGAEPTGLLPYLVPAFSPVAVASVATLTVTGALASWIHLPDLAALWQTEYGRLLLLKVALALAVMSLGALNWRRLSPTLTRPHGPRAMRRAAVAELAFAAAVLAATTLLVRTSPPGG